VVVSQAAASAGARVSHAVVWHELECGSYTADLPLWLELAERSGGPVLDIGAGTGRVARVLARAGFSVTALERDAELLAALRSHARELAIEGVLADARDFALERRDFGLCVVPMNTLQLFGAREQRAAFLRCARAHVRARGVLAVAILPDAEPFDRERGQLAPAPETASVDGLRFISSPTRVAVGEDAIVIERERTVQRGGRGSRATVVSEHDSVALARLNAGQLRAEIAAAGFRPAPTRTVPATDEHVGSEVVIARG
jgi:SAM-dependent methyltransferase